MGLHRAVVLSEGEVLHISAVATEPVEKPVVIAICQVSYGQYAMGLETFLGLGADAGKGSDGQGGEKGDLFARRHDCKSVRLFEVGGYLGDGLTHACAHRDGQSKLVFDAPLERSR